jgi:hypothetical protein
LVDDTRTLKFEIEKKAKTYDLTIFFSNGNRTKGISEIIAKQIPALLSVRKNNAIKITDEEGIFNLMLIFVHMGMTMAKPNQMMKMLQIAAKYQYDSLIRACIKHLDIAVCTYESGFLWFSVKPLLEGRYDISQIDERAEAAVVADHAYLSKDQPLEIVQQYIKIMCANGKNPLNQMRSWIKVQKTPLDHQVIHDLLNCIDTKYLELRNSSDQVDIQMNEMMEKIRANNANLTENRENCVRRCDHLEGGWRTGKVDALDFVVSKDFTLTSIGICARPSENKVTLQVLQGNQVLFKKEFLFIYCTEVQKLDVHVDLIAEKRYTVTVLIEGEVNTLSCFGCTGQFTLPNGGTITLMDSEKDVNGTSAVYEGASGQFPDFYF